MKSFHSHFNLFAQLFFTLILLIFASLSQAEELKMQTLVGQATGFIPWELRNLSGLAHCDTTPEFLWAINDDDEEAIIYALSKQAKIIHRHKLVHDRNKGWEDLSCGRCADSEGECLYLTQRGKNSSQKIRVLMIPMPLKEEVSEGEFTVKRRKFILTFPSKGHPTEANLVHPKYPLLVIVTKEKTNPAKPLNPKVFAIDFSKHDLSAKMLPLTEMGDLPLIQLGQSIPAGGRWITSGDFSKDGKWILLTSYTHLYRAEWPLAQDPAKIILQPIWAGVNRPKIKSVAMHVNKKQFWLASKWNAAEEPLLLMDIPD